MNRKTNFTDIVPSPLSPLLKDFPAQTPSPTQRAIEQLSRVSGYQFSLEHLSTANPTRDAIESGKPFHLPIGSSETMGFGMVDRQTLRAIDHPSVGFDAIQRILSLIERLGSGQPITVSTGISNNFEDVARVSGQSKEAITKTLIECLVAATNRTLSLSAELSGPGATALTSEQWENLRGTLAAIAPQGQDVDQIFPGMMTLLNKISVCHISPLDAPQQHGALLKRLGVSFSKTGQEFATLKAKNPAGYQQIITTGIQTTIQRTLHNLIPASWVS